MTIFQIYCTAMHFDIRRTNSFCFQPKGQSSTWFSILRFVFIPLLMFCNAQPRHNLPVLFNSDLIYTLIIITFAFSGGFISTLAFISLPEYVNRISHVLINGTPYVRINSSFLLKWFRCVLLHEQEVASTMLAIWFGVSISIGSVLSIPLINLL